MKDIKTTADYKEALYEKQHLECVTLRTRVSSQDETIERISRELAEAVAAMREVQHKPPRAETERLRAESEIDRAAL